MQLFILHLINPFIIIFVSHKTTNNRLPKLDQNISTHSFVSKQTNHTLNSNIILNNNNNNAGSNHFSIQAELKPVTFKLPTSYANVNKSESNLEQTRISKNFKYLFSFNFFSHSERKRERGRKSELCNLSIFEFQSTYLFEVCLYYLVLNKIIFFIFIFNQYKYKCRVFFKIFIKHD